MDASPIVKTCGRCHGERSVVEHLKNLSGRQSDSCLEPHIVSCDMCSGKGHITQRDIDDYYLSWWTFGKTQGEINAHLAANPGKYSAQPG